MNDKNKDELSCSDFREGYDNIESISAPEKVHVLDCSECLDWKEEIDQFNMMAKEMPQFEISEAVTQNILSDVKEIDKEERQKLNTWACVFAVGAFAWIILITDSLETVWGLASWFIGLAILLGLKYIVQEPNQKLNPQESI